MAKLAAKKFVGVALSVPLYFLCFITVTSGGISGAGSIRLMFSAVLLAAFIRFADEISDYKKDYVKNRTLMPLPALVICAAVCAAGASALALRQWYISILSCMIVAACGLTEKYAPRVARVLKIFILPLLITVILLLIVITTEKAFTLYSYLITGLALLLSVSIYVYSVKKNHHLTLPKIENIGGKAYNLLRIKGVDCPRFTVIDSHFLLNAVKLDDPARAINGRLSKLKKNKLYAVRSSAVGEDSAENSFAGIMDSFLNVPYREIADKVLACYGSAFSGRAETYRKARNIETDARAAVIVQEMVNPDYAGVMFTVNPVSGNPDEIMICAVRGLGEKLVSGSADSSDYIIGARGKVTGKRGEDILPPAIIKKLRAMALTVQTQCNTFQDIEFAVKKHSVYFLQARAVTNYAGIDISAPKKVLDNSNIIESYSGITLPLTISFAKEMYYNVYKETIKQSGVSNKIVNSLEDTFRNMLEDHSGRIYYNLNSWYRLNGIFPNTKSSTDDMERMMGVSTKMKNKRIKMGLPDILRFIKTLLSRIKHIRRDSDIYLEKFNKTTYPYSFADFADFDEKALVRFYDGLVSNTLKYYTVPIVNDVAAMMSYGKLMRKAGAAGITGKEGYISSLLSGQGDVESAKSVGLIKDITAIICADEQMKNDFTVMSPAGLEEKYGETPVYGLIQEYLIKFGARVPNELKLETETMLEKPSIFFDLLKNQISGGVIADEAQHKLKPAVNKKIEKTLEKTKYYISNRERLRLTRTYMFSAARRMFLRFGGIYEEKGYLDAKRDIFYLTKDEIFAAANGEGTESLQRLAAKRKAGYAEYEKIQTPDRIVFYGDMRLDISDGSITADGGRLTGIPSGAGIVTGEVKIIDSASMGGIKDKIVVAKRTDPGYITVFTLCRGLIVEKGSVLSHSAVVARELGIPAVVGVKDACTALKDGDTVRLDSVKGEITILDEQPV